MLKILNRLKSGIGFPFFRRFFLTIGRISKQCMLSISRISSIMSGLQILFIHLLMLTHICCRIQMLEYILTDEPQAKSRRRCSRGKSRWSRAQSSRRCCRGCQAKQATSQMKCFCYIFNSYILVLTVSRLFLQYIHMFLLLM